MSPRRTKTSNIWRFFTELSNEKAKCHICETVLCYKSSTSNLRKHLMRKHPTIQTEIESLTDFRMSDCSDIDISQDPLEEMDTKPILTTLTLLSPVPETEQFINKRSKTSHIWEFFKILNNEKAKCNMCKTVLSYNSSITNLRKHLVHKHPAIQTQLEHSSSDLVNQLSDCSDIDHSKDLKEEIDEIEQITEMEEIEEIDIKPMLINLTSLLPEPEPVYEQHNMKRKLTNIWQFFTVLNKNLAKCNICKKELCKSNPSNLRKHIRRSHPTVQRQIESTSSNLTTPPSVTTEIDHSQDLLEEVDTPPVPTISTSLVSVFESEQIRSNRTNTRIIWTFFTVLSRTKAECNMCKTVLRYNSTSSNLRKHLMRKHPTVQHQTRSVKEKVESSHFSTEPSVSSDKDPLEEIGIPPMPTTFISLPYVPPTKQNISLYIPKKLSYSNKDKIDNNLLNMFINDFQPFSIVEDVGFRKFVNALNPFYELPNSQIISRIHIPSLYESCLDDVKNIVKSLSNVCLTTECWTSSTNINYMAVTIHFVDTDFTIKSVLLKCSNFDKDSRTSINVANDIKQLLEEWNLSNKVLMAISDYDSIIKKAIKNELGINHFVCFAHTIHLIVIEALKVVEDIIQKVKKIVNFFEINSKAASKLIVFQKNDDMTLPKTLLQEKMVIWNSTFYMIQRFVELEDAVKTTIGLLNVSIPTLSDHNWIVLKELIQILKPFENITKIESGDNYITASYVIVLTKSLKDLCCRFKDGEWSEISIKVIHTLEEGINQQWSSIENNTTLMVCTFLDPRFKSLPFLDKSNVKNIVLGMLPDIKDEPIEPSTNQSNTANETDNYSLWYSLDQVVSKQKPYKQNSESKSSIEINRYLEMAIVNRNENPLKWWKHNGHNYPYLITLVRKYFCAVATSVPCERLSSNAGYILQERRKMLCPSILEQLLFLNVNSKIT